MDDKKAAATTADNQERREADSAADQSNSAQSQNKPAAADNQTKANNENNGADHSSSKTEEKDKSEKKPFWTWDRVLDVVKLVATVWVALLGSVVTMQFNERQHELNRIEAIAQMLPHMGEEGKAKDGSAANDHMGRDGAIWAIFRTANNRKMLRDLAALFPEDIYRVVSSIALGGELEHDSDALVALQVSSEKLAAQYSSDPSRAEAASKLYAQALALKTRSLDDPSPLHVLDLTQIVSNAKPTDDQLEHLIKSINDLADQHLKDIETQTIATKDKKSSGSHWESKQLYLRARKLGTDNKDPQVQEQVMRADLALASLYVGDGIADDAFAYFKDGLEAEAIITGKPINVNLKSLDKDGDGFAGLPELKDAISEAQARLKQIYANYKDKGAEIN